ncbi:riboflavin kinase [Sitodiplosis mosellana]|uniref:riboflavin kinase n=1 Tax=Sitodiplosis mosellana TaxID=263140 RepID=UPI002444E6A9|nr:riboflavin kinase [Sitodiplosis mosellana]XP_055297533.1 riboflavin kinase [Sitodiplosis mosellana]XP_055297541.1 riboflavin kinase [Sitodiplosis mosellana]XP_055297549.1 riboflavin kinase [Sitodiplosis mosellana]
MNCLPYFCTGPIVKGFGRGSKELGCPTANVPLEVVQQLPDELQTGVYFGWASIENGDVHKAVLSIGWNPFYNNKEKSMEAHIIHKFDEDFYGKQMKLCICGYLRPETNFDSLDALKAAINEDIKNAKSQLDTEQFTNYKFNDYFKQ